MNKKVADVFKGWLKLTDAEKTEFLRELNKIYNAPPEKKVLVFEELRESVTKVTLGPMSSDVCTCCGR